MQFLREDRDYNLISGRTLSEEQIDGIEFLFNRTNAILGLQTGLGKTFTSLTAAFNILKQTKKTIFFITCPKSANSAFKKELEDVLKEPYSIVTTDEQNIVNGSRIFLFNYSNIEPMERYLTALRKQGYQVCLIADEVHCLGSLKSDIANTMRNYRKYFTLVWGLSASILLNDLEDMYRAIDFVCPNYLGTLPQFQKKYIRYKTKYIYRKGRKVKYREVVGYENLEDLSERLKGIVLTKRLKYNIQWHYFSCNLNEQEEDFYKKAAQGLIDKDDTDKQMSSRLHDLQRVVDGYHKDMKLDEIPSKIKLLLNVIKKLLDKGEGCLVYTEYEDTYKYIIKMIKKYKKDLNYNNIYQITGKTKYSDRVICEKSIKEGDIAVISKAGCQSLNLQGVNNIIVYDTTFSVGYFIQLIGRIARMDTKYDTLSVYILEAKDTIDTYRKILIQEHTKVINTLFGKEGNLPNVREIDRNILEKYRKFYKDKLLWKKI